MRQMTENNQRLTQEILESGGNENDVRPYKLPQYLAGMSATLGSLAAGLVFGWSSPAGEDGANLSYPFEIDPNEFSWVTSIFSVGAAVVCMPIGILTDLIGRRRAMLILTVPFTVGWACVIWPNSITTLILGRFILGVSGGAFGVTIPMYTGEIADPEIRGRLGCYAELFFSAGILFAFALGLLHNMFWLSLISASVPLIFCAVFFFMPETPTYYLMKGNERSARETLIWLRGPHYDVDSELAEQRDAQAEAKRNRVSFFMAIKSRVAVKGLFIAYGLMFFQKFSGIDGIIFYASTIFKDAIGDDADWSTIVMASMQITAVFLFTFVIDRWGRRILLMISGIAMCLSTLIFGLYFYFDNKGTAMGSLSWLPLVCICSFNIFIAIGFNPIPWMMVGELFSPQIKGAAASSACLLNWLLSFVVTKFYVEVKNAIGSDRTFWMFSVICGLAVIFVYFMVPETKGKTLEQIQIELAGGSVNDSLTRHKLDSCVVREASM